ncbi:MAG: CRISPR-associated endonuclease Cas1 [Chromatiaceae bacterium]|nr:CRISPR-associated endonuclease Cas1 [Chromatiaceae bacterium]
MIIHTARPCGEPAPRPRDDDARPLYIAPGGDTQIQLDGPALSIQRGERAEQLFPLRRLSRIHCAEDTYWTTEALMACAKRGIAILFVDETGSVVARLLGRPGLHDHLGHRLAEFLLLPQAMGMYEHWRQTYERRVAAWTGTRLGLATSERDPVRCRAGLQALAAHYAVDPQEMRTRQWLRGIALGWMQAHLQELGLGAQSELAQSGAPPLARDLTELLYWYLEPARIGWLKRRWLAAERQGVAVRPPTHAEVVRIFEAHATRVAAHGLEITGNLHRWLIHET